MSSPPSLVWFVLLDSVAGKPYKGTNAAKVSVTSHADVADFRDAVKAKHSNKLSSVDAADLLVYQNKDAFDNRNAAVDEGKEEPLKSSHLLAGLGESEEEALVVVVPSSAGSSFRGDEMEVDSSPTISAVSPSSTGHNIILMDGIDIHTEHLHRPDLLDKLADLVYQYRFVRLTSPAASGKTSLLELYQHSLKDTEVIWIRCLSVKSCFELFAENGIYLESNKCETHVGKRNTIIFLDDAQAKYAEVTFWHQLVKSSSHWMPSNVRFVISSTYLLSGGTQSPVEFEAFPKLERDDFLLAADESEEFLALPVIGLPQNMKSETLKQVLIRECGGLIGALRQSIDSLKQRFAKDPQPSETALLQHFLSDELLQSITRCFGSTHSAPIGDDFKLFLKKIFVDEKVIQNSFTNPQDELSYSSLKKAGILVELPFKTFGFSSSLAKRYYFKWMFPKRSVTVPSSLRQLIGEVVSNMSSTVLKKSTLPGDFPKEAVFQHLFMEGLALHTPPNCSICPELSKIFPPDANLNSQKAIAGEIDFYLNGSLRWGIELLVNGDGIGEHLSRFSPPSGKYLSLAVNDYAVVDLRRNVTGQPTDISKHPNRVSVFFKNDDYSVAQCLFGEDTAAIKIRLAN